jgi:hypothetical protein
VVGGVAALLHGAPVNTFDLDVVHSTDASNVSRLLKALDELDAIYRAQPERNLRPGASHLESAGRQLLLTRVGPLDLLGSIGNRRDYDALLENAVEMELAAGLRVRVLDLPTLIAVKEEVDGEKGLAILPVLRTTLAESKR